MRGILSTAWGISVVASLLGTIIIAGFGIYLNVPATVIVFAAANFSACLIALILLAIAVSIILRSRGTSSDVGATLEREIESPAGQVELRQMGFSSLLTVAIVQELYNTLVKRDEPLWFLEFLNVVPDVGREKDYGAFNRYLEWTLLISAGVFAAAIGLLLAYFGYATGADIYAGSARANLMGFVCGASSCLFGGILALAFALFGASVIRRVSLLYTLRAKEEK